MQDADVQRVNNARRRRRVVRQSQCVPAAAEIHAPLTALSGRGRSVIGNNENLSDSGEELIGRQAIEIAHNAIVRQYLQLIVGKEHAEKEVVLFTADKRKALLF